MNGSSNVAMYHRQTIPKHATQWGVTGTTVGTSWSTEMAAEQFVSGTYDADEAIGRVGLSVDGEAS